MTAGQRERALELLRDPDLAERIVSDFARAGMAGEEANCLVGYLAAVAFMNSFSTDQFPVTVDIRWFTYVGAAAAMFVVAGLSLIPAVRSVKRIDVAKIVRERAT